MNTDWCETGDFLYEMGRKVENHIREHFELVYSGRDNVGLDSRCGPIYINQEYIAVDKFRAGTIEYYGGFEYVDKDHRQEMGDFVFYSRESSRVADHIDRFFGVETSEEEDVD
jgi:hypothetical protein